jgi:hypothetical protein
VAAERGGYAVDVYLIDPDGPGFETARNLCCDGLLVRDHEDAAEIASGRFAGCHARTSYKAGLRSKARLQPSQQKYTV